MTVVEILSAISTRLNDLSTAGLPATGQIYYTETEALTAIDEAQKFFSLLTLCLESSGTVPLTSGTCFYSIRDYLTGFLVPLRVSVSGVRLRPAGIADLDGRYYTWQNTPGTPERYLQAGMNLFAVVPQPTGSTSATVLFAREYTTVSSSGDSLESPREYHPAIVAYGLYYLLQKRGGQYLQYAITEWQKYLTAASQCADYVRRRNRARQYDTLPFEHRLPVKKEGALANG